MPCIFPGDIAAFVRRTGDRKLLPTSIGYIRDNKRWSSFFIINYRFLFPIFGYCPKSKNVTLSQISGSAGLALDYVLKDP